MSFLDFGLRVLDFVDKGNSSLSNNETTTVVNILVT